MTLAPGLLYPNGMMTTEMVARTIQLIIAPVVMITSCCILAGGMLTYYSAIGERLRLALRERVDLLRSRAGSAGMPDEILAERLEEIDDEVPGLLSGHRLMRTALGAVLLAVAFFILDMFTIAASLVADRAGLAAAILFVFLAGVASLRGGEIAAGDDMF